MKVTILGAGVGALHYLSDKDINRYPPAFFVTWGEKDHVLFECSQAVDQRLENAGIDYASIHHMAISHPHPDHCVPIPFIQSIYLKGLWGREKFVNKDLSIYGPDHLITNFPILWNIYLQNQEGKYYDWPTLHFHAMSHDKTYHTLGSGKLTARKVYHGFGKCDALAYRLETSEGTIAYSGDTGDCDGVREVAKNADLFICEASARVGDFQSAKNYGHLDPYTIGDIAKKSGAKKIMLFHYTGLDNDADVIADVKKSGFLGDVIAGKDGQEIVV